MISLRRVLKLEVTDNTLAMKTLSVATVSKRGILYITSGFVVISVIYRAIRFADRQVTQALPKSFANCHPRFNATDSRTQVKRFSVQIRNRCRISERTPDEVETA